jgi:hypothetical protein
MSATLYCCAMVLTHGLELVDIQPQVLPQRCSGTSAAASSVLYSLRYGKQCLKYNLLSEAFCMCYC